MYFQGYGGPESHLLPPTLSHVRGQPQPLPPNTKVLEFGLAGLAASGQELPSVYKAVKFPVRQHTG